MNNNNLFTYDAASTDDMLYFNALSFYSPEPDDDEEESSDESEGSNTGNDDPAIDNDVVHSPVVTQPGGKPRNS